MPAVDGRIVIYQPKFLNMVEEYLSRVVFLSILVIYF